MEMFSEMCLDKINKIWLKKPSIIDFRPFRPISIHQSIIATVVVSAYLIWFESILLGK